MRAIIYGWQWVATHRGLNFMGPVGPRNSSLIKRGCYESILGVLGKHSLTDNPWKLQYQHSDKIDIPATINYSLQDCLQDNQIYCCNSKACGYEGLIHEKMEIKHQPPCPQEIVLHKEGALKHHPFLSYCSWLVTLGSAFLTCHS